MTALPPPDGALAGIWRSTAFLEDLEALCDRGGRFAGSESEARARTFLQGRLAALAAAIPGARLVEHPFDYDGWAREACRLARLDDGGARPLPAHSLVWSPPMPPGGLEAEVLDLGRGTPEDFAHAGDLVRGRLVLVRHEYPFASGVIHRRIKYGLARERGAAGFLIACNLPGQVLVTGSSGTGGPDDVPAAGITLEAGAALAARGGRRPRARLEIAVRRGPARAVNLGLEVPGRQAEWVLLSAHYDGHDLAESALDNGTGVAAALEVVRALGPHVPAARDEGLDLGIVLPFMPNSDHANFARLGIPALRLVAGFDDPRRGRATSSPPETPATRSTRPISRPGRSPRRASSGGRWPRRRRRRRTARRRPVPDLAAPAPRGPGPGRLRRVRSEHREPAPRRGRDDRFSRRQGRLDVPDTRGARPEVRPCPTSSPRSTAS